ncbi:N-substituted formamide deformylase precursor [Pseudobythopirellula maris]|uniref:N-substituted formamide deformylase n=1 Tax=Pseudobythopirellula maris TaxID=2527991 RepID=A0A5C5ZNB0_9BACT|nr:amidohydrolase [Pseudobythopirellula maris]TWT88658.1 N-substituted formamide deformylase precursor [Pseudobythopirellula maris]
MAWSHWWGASLSLACALLAPASAASETRDPESLLITGGRVWTADPDRPWAEALLTVGDKIAFVGDLDEAQPRAPAGARVVDATGGLVTPGWFDSHIHLLSGGMSLSQVQLRDAATKEEFVRRLRNVAAGRTPGQWIQGGDWDHTLWGGDLPTRDWIDAVTPDNPVWIGRLDGHMALANTAAFKAAGFDESAVAPPGGAIERDERGRPTGLLRDNAMALVGHAAPPASDTERLEALDAATDYLFARGVTSVYHVGSLNDLRLLRAAHTAGRLRLRVHAATQLSQWRRLAEEIERHGAGDEWLRAGALKGFVDGSLGSHTAAFLEPYDDKPTDRGLLVNSPQDLDAWTRGADAAGLQVAVHAIGDRAIRLQLDVFERVARANGPRDRRFRIEHAQHIAAEDLPRFAELGVIASMQPYHCIDDGRWALPLIGATRCETTYAFRGLIDAGARVALGSDWPVAPPTPLEGVYAAVTRRTLDDKNPGGWFPAQKISVGEALRGYTTEAAYAEFAEQEKGALKPGLLADVVIVDRDLFTAPQETIADARVRCTVVGGRVVYESPAAASGP